MQDLPSVSPDASRSSQSERDWKSAFLSCVDDFPASRDKSRALYFYTQDHYADLDGALDIIRKDPFLSVEVVRRAHSATYGSRGADSLEEAMNTLGLEQLGRISLRIWLSNVIPQSLATYFLSGSSFVNRSIGTGAAMLSFYLGDSEREDSAYAIGLLHSLGRVVVNEAVKRSGVKDLYFQEKDAAKLAMAETNRFGINHAEVGSLALESWGFSKRICDPIGRQFEASPQSDGEGWIESLRFARMIADRVIDGLRGAPDPMRGEAAKLHRGKRLGEVFDSTFRLVENEMISELD